MFLLECSSHAFRRGRQQVQQEFHPQNHVQEMQTALDIYGVISVNIFMIFRSFYPNRQFRSVRKVSYLYSCAKFVFDWLQWYCDWPVHLIVHASKWQIPKYSNKTLGCTVGQWACLFFLMQINKISLVSFSFSELSRHFLKFLKN